MPASRLLAWHLPLIDHTHFSLDAVAARDYSQHSTTNRGAYSIFTYLYPMLYRRTFNSAVNCLTRALTRLQRRLFLIYLIQLDLLPPQRGLPLRSGNTVV